MRSSHTVHVLVVLVLSAGCSQPLSPTSPTSLQRETVALTASSGAAVAQGAVTTAETPFKGSLEGTVAFAVVGPTLAHVTISASGVSTHLGQFTVEVPHDVDLSIAVGKGIYTFTAANGDRLVASFTGTADTSTPIFVIEEQATITGGTGRFANATGSFSVSRLYDTTAGTTTGTFTGMVSTKGGH
jgi:hypothetical protein